MARSFLPHHRVSPFLDSLRQLGEIHGPARDATGVTTFRPIDDYAEMTLQYQRTAIPPKKYLLPYRETILSCTPGTGYTIQEDAVCPVVLVGVHPCDLAGIAYLDGVFLADPPDPQYRRRRNALFLVGTSCDHDKYCLKDRCTVDRPVGFDLYLQHTEGGFILQHGSPRGNAVLEASAQFLEDTPPSPEHAPEPAAVCKTALPPPADMTAYADNPLWEAFAQRCLACGACSACCPTCYCFDVREQGLLDGNGARRLREWDNCLFKAHGEVAGGGNFRRSRLERLRYRFLHKYLGFGPQRGSVSCVACGRCRAVCPVEIDLAEIFWGKQP